MEEFKKHKRAKKYDCCVICGSTKKKHKGRGIGLCCWDKERLKNPRRFFQKKMARLKFEMKTKILKKLELPKKKKSIFGYKEGREKREKEAKRFRYFTTRGKKKKEAGKQVIQINKNGKTYFLPILAEEFEKPKFYDEKYSQKMRIYKRNLEIFDFCSKFKLLEDFKK